jgi:glycosyltransferase involved in cell wall biosynthesis
MHVALVNQQAVRFTLIVATIGRIDPLARLLDSLALQSRHDFEVIVIDQNEQLILAAILEGKNWPFPILHVSRPSCGGASAARNLGVPLARGKILVFPDDDCWYPPDYLQRMDRIFQQTKAMIVTGRATDLRGRTINGRFHDRPGPITRRRTFISQIEWNMGVCASLMRELRGYDEAISLGGPTPWQGGEGYDLILRALRSGASCYYDPDLIGHHHELPVSTPDYRMIAKALIYARGLGYVLRKHRFGLCSLSWWVSRSLFNLMGALVTLRPDRARYFMAQTRGRVEGWFGGM